MTGLAASTAYSFTVEATDANGTSAASSAVNVTTLANSCTTKPSCTNRIGGLWHNQFRHEPELDGGHSACKLHDQLVTPYCRTEPRLEPQPALRLP